MPIRFLNGVHGDGDGDGDGTGAGAGAGAQKTEGGPRGMYELYGESEIEGMVSHIRS